MTLTLGAWLHDLSPWIWRITPDFGVRWYGVSYLTGFVIAYFLFRWLAKRGATLVPADRVADAIILAILGVVVGGRLGYVLFYEPSLLGFSGDFPYWGVLAINRGGMASHGGMIGVILAAWRISRGFKNDAGVLEGRCPPLHVMDVVALLAPFGLMLGRIANFVNGELLGLVVAKPGEPAPWWAVKYPQEVVQFARDQLPQTDAQFSQLQQLGLSRLSPEERALATDPSLQQLDPEHFRAFWQMGYERLLGSLQHGSPDAHRQLEPLISARAPSQLVQAACEGLALALVIWFVARKPRLPGVVGCWFLITYGVLRIATEFVRLPDAQLAVQRPLGLSRGQWLSSVMVAVGVFFLFWITRRGGTRLGGWMTTKGRGDTVGAPASD